jgi:hypothetical protein
VEIISTICSLLVSIEAIFTRHRMSLTVVDPDLPGVACYDFAYQQCQSNNNRKAQCRRPSGIFQRLVSFRHEDSPGPAYLLSVSNIRMLHNTFPLDTIKTLLNQPRTIIVFLVPIKLLNHPHLLSYSRQSKAKGSCLQILPFDPSDDVNDDQVAECITKFCKVRAFNGWMSFDEDLPSRLRLCAIVRAVRESQES